MAELPILFILDIDKTLIGDGSFISKLNTFALFINKSCKRNKINNSNNICKINSNFWKNNISSNFFRPFIKELINGIRKTYPNSEFFVYSTGISEYVNIIVNLLEKYIGEFKFNKPYFSREKAFIDSKNFYEKDINFYTKSIIKTLKNKYPSISDKIDEILSERTIIIDDLNVWNNDYRHIQIKPYDFNPIYEFDYNLLKMIYENDYIYEYCTTKGLLSIERGNNLNNFLFNYHIEMINKYKQNENNNNYNLNDNEFEKLLKIITNLNKKTGNLFTKANLNMIKKKMET